MGDIHYACELPKKVVLNVPPTHRLGDRFERMIQIDRASFERIADYSRSQPTGPSPGRIYRKNHGWPVDMDDNWFVYCCVRDPEDEKGVYHVPYLVVLVDDAPEGVPSRHKPTARRTP